MLFLKVQSDGDPQPHALRDGQTLIVGRAFDCDVVINHDSVSRRHAQLVVRGARASVSDLNSSNGVYWNGERVKEAELSSGDVLRFGSVEASIAEPPAREQAVADDAVPAIQLEHTIYRRVGTLPRGAATVVDAERVIRLLGEIARTLVASLSLGETLDRVVDLLLAHIPADRAMLSMRASAAGDFVPAVTRLKSGTGAASTPFSISRTVADLVLRERVAVLTADVRRDERFDAAQSLFRDDVRSLMCAPLCGYGADTSIMGLLYVDNGWNHQFSVGDLELFTALADYASVAVSQARLDEGLKREARQRERLARYHSPAVVERVLQDEHSSEAIIGQERDVTILFADIVKFTTMAEDMAADEVVRILNQFFTSMTDIVFAHEGTVDKFIGDAILVVFGAPIAQADHALRAIETARAMQAAIADLNVRRVAPRPLEIRIALHSGSAVAGDVGSAQRLEYTVVGDVVNTAARLQSEVAAPGEIILSRATLDRAGEPLDVETIGPVKVKGRSSTVEAFRLVTAASRPVQVTGDGLESPMLTVHTLTHPGSVRDINEDSVLWEAGLALMAIADGMGGHNAGEVASRLAIEAVRSVLGERVTGEEASWPFGFNLSTSVDVNRLLTAMKTANRKVFREAEERPEYMGMGTTLVAATVAGRRLTFSSVGDSRLYLLEGSELRQLTRDDSWVVMLTQESGLAPEAYATHPMRHVLTSVIGGRSDIDVEVQEIDLVPGQTLMFSTDGLHVPVPAQTIRTILESEPKLDLAAQALVDSALKLSGGDNITVLLARFDD